MFLHKLGYDSFLEDSHQTLGNISYSPYHDHHRRHRHHHHLDGFAGCRVGAVRMIPLGKASRLTSIWPWRAPERHWRLCTPCRTAGVAQGAGHPLKRPNLNAVISHICGIESVDFTPWACVIMESYTLESLLLIPVSASVINIQLVISNSKRFCHSETLNVLVCWASCSPYTYIYI